MGLLFHRFLLHPTRFQGSILVTNVNENNLTQKTIYNFRVPPEGAKVIPVLLDFTADTVYTLDLSQMEQQGRFSQLQAIYIDLSQTDSALTILVVDVQQTIVAKGRTDGYYAVLASNPTMLTFTSSANAIIFVHLINAPIPGVTWATQ